MERGGRRTRAGLLAAGLAAAVLLGGCAQRTAEPASGQIFAMDTIMSMDVYGEGGEEALARAEETIYRLEDLWAVTDENSEIWALNHSGGAWVDLSQETADLLSQALELCALAAGEADLFVTLRSCPWDHNAGRIILAEAGGSLCDLEGEFLPLDRRTPVLAANAPETLRLVRERYLGAAE